MHRDAWRAPTSPEEARRRAAGRRRHNALRQFRAHLRRAKLARLLRSVGWPRRGSQAQLARELGVSRATITRDIQAIVGARRR